MITTTIPSLTKSSQTLSPSRMPPDFEFSVHPETTQGHPEPFDRLPATKRGTGRINSAKNPC